MSEIAADYLLGASLPSRLIAWYGEGYGGFSHVAPIIVDTYMGARRERYLDARNDVVAGVPSGVHIRDPKAEKWIKRCRVSLGVSQDEYQEWEDNLRARIGDQYARTDIVDFITGRDQHDAGHWICSAHWIDSLQHIHRIVYPLPIPAHQITPNGSLLLVAQANFRIGDLELAA